MSLSQTTPTATTSTNISTTSASAPIPSLSSTCSICHSPPKYTCPGCSARTCSLPCVKLHKARSVCSGQRNPGAYLPRRKLGTPAAFDMDFNFISSLERQLERGERVLEDRGLARAVTEGGVVEPGKGEESVQGKGKRRAEARSEAAVRKRCNEREIHWVRIASGLERARRNETRWHANSKSVQWTVEWILGSSGGKKEMGRALDGKTLEEGWKFHCGKGEGGRGKKGKKGKGEKVEAGLGPEKEAEVVNEYFLLHVPGRSHGNVKTVLQVDRSTTLGEALKGMEVIEFPTIEVINVDPKDLDKDSYAVYGHHLDIDVEDRRLNAVADGSKKRPAEETPSELVASNKSRRTENSHED